MAANLPGGMLGAVGEGESTYFPLSLTGTPRTYTNQQPSQKLHPVVAGGCRRRGKNILSPVAHWLTHNLHEPATPPRTVFNRM